MDGSTKEAEEAEEELDEVEPSCSICALLKECDIVTPTKLKEGYYCRFYRITSPAEVRARESIIKDLGVTALRNEVERLKPKSARPKARRRRRNA